MSLAICLPTFRYRWQNYFKRRHIPTPSPIPQFCLICFVFLFYSFLTSRNSLEAGNSLFWNKLARHITYSTGDRKLAKYLSPFPILLWEFLFSLFLLLLQNRITSPDNFWAYGRLVGLLEQSWKKKPKQFQRIPLLRILTFFFPESFPCKFFVLSVFSQTFFLKEVLKAKGNGSTWLELSWIVKIAQGIVLIGWMGW